MKEQTKTKGGNVDNPPIDPDKGSAAYAPPLAHKGGDTGSVDDSNTGKGTTGFAPSLKKP